MAQPKPYSERFLWWDNIGWSPLYNVPPGFRAVMKCVMSMNQGSVTRSAVVQVRGESVWFGPVPGPGYVSPPGVMLVVYAGESMQIYHEATQQVTQISGYLLSG